MDTAKFQFLLNFESGPIKEPPVSNELFLESFVRFGVWVRILAAYEHYKTIINSEMGSPSRFSAIIALYQLLGMLYEDATANLVSWAAWAKNRNLLLADLHQKIFLTEKQVSEKTGLVYHAEANDKLLQRNNKSVGINARLYFGSLTNLSGKETLEWLGIPWKRQPSVKLVPRKLWSEWETFPMRTGEFIKFLADEPKSLITASYNKLKHGPQMAIMNIREIAVRGRGFPEDKVKLTVLEGECVRLLFDGARTQEHENEYGASKRVAPFLLHHPDYIDKMFWDVMVYIALQSWELGYYLFRGIYRRDIQTPPDKRLDEMFLYKNSRIVKQMNNA